MSDNPVPKKVTREQHAQERSQRDTEVLNLRRRAKVHFRNWESYTKRFPELKNVDTLEKFHRAQGKNPQIHPSFWIEFDQGEHLKNQADELEKQITTEIENEKSRVNIPHFLSHHEEHGHPVYIEQDARYRALYEADPLVKRLRQEQPKLALSSIAEIEDGVLGLNPAIIPHLKALDPSFDEFLFEENLRGIFAKIDPQAARHYAFAESKRIYKNPTNDPAIKRMEREIQKKTAEKIKAAAAPQGITPHIDTTPHHIASATRKEALLNFARVLTVKAAAYAKTMSEFQPAVNQAEEEKRRGISLEGTAAHYALLGMTAGDWLAQSKDSSGTEGPPEGLTILSSGTTPANITPAGITPAGGTTPFPPNTTPFPTTTPAPKTTPFPTTAQLKRPMPTNIHASNVHPAPPRFRRKGNSNENDTGDPQRPPRRNRRRGLPTLPNFGGNGVVGLINSASWFAPPRIYILLAAVFLAIIMFIFGSSEVGKANPDGTFPIYISKTGPTEVPNPRDSDTSKPDRSDIIYEITVTYAGSADRIVVTDPLDENAEFVSADGPGNPTYDKSSHTVTWNILPGGASSASPTPTPRRTQSGLLNTLSSIRIPQVVYAQSDEEANTTTFNLESFRAEGLPAPQNPNPVELNSDALELWKKHFMNHAVKAANAVGVDVGWVGFWAFYEGINFNTTFNNCNEDGDRFNPNKECYSDSWQVGPAVRPYDLPESTMQDAFDTMYGNHDPETIRRVGQQMIDRMQERHNTRLTYPASTFPRLTIEELIRQDTDETRHWFVHLTRDDAIGMYYIARTFKGHVDASDQMSQRMCGWGACGAGQHYDPQRTSNYIKAVYDAGLTGGGANDGDFGNIPDLTLIVRPRTSDSWVINQAYAEVIGARSRLPGSSGGRGRPGQPLPSNDVNQIKQVLCNDYNVCPTRVSSGSFASSSDWTLEQLEALWNVVQRIYESETYKTLAIGNYKLEIARVNCYLDPDSNGPSCGSTWGFYSGLTAPQLASVSNARFIGITDKAAEQIQSQVTWEGLFAHEIGHSASGGTLSGGLAERLGGNEPYEQVLKCGDKVSIYGRDNYENETTYVRRGNENNSEAIQYYMTAVEEADAGYLGSGTNLKSDFPCTYNALRQYYFDGVEF